MEKIRIEQHSFGGLLWVGGWLFTIGFLKLDVLERRPRHLRMAVLRRGLGEQDSYVGFVTCRIGEVT